ELAQIEKGISSLKADTSTFTVMLKARSGACRREGIRAIRGSVSEVSGPLVPSRIESLSSNWPVDYETIDAAAALSSDGDASVRAAAVPIRELEVSRNPFVEARILGEMT